MRIQVIIFLMFMCISGLANATDLALVGAKIYTAPTTPPIENGSIILRAGKIAAVGPYNKIKIPKNATVIDCKGMVVTAGFWNSHVHFLPPGLLHAENLSAGQIDSELQKMFTSWGFTTVFDLASVLQNTTLIRHRIETGEVKGPRIFTVGEPFWEKGGTPFYIKGYLAANHIDIPEVDSALQARERVRRQIQNGADGIKIFANSVERNDTLTMPLELAKAIADEAHRAHKPVFAHVANDQGIEVALKSGVNILAHTTPNGSPWSPELVNRMLSKHTALTPTLTLWDEESKKAHFTRDESEAWMQRASDQLRVFSQAGGQVLFGTDIGYIQHYDTAEEFTWMSRAGMNFPQILASLTTNPAQRFGYSKHSGRIAKGMDADLVVLNGDPQRDITALSRVRYTIRRGEIIYSEK
jgi:imidazolonepropionase-like amidohydrolase